MRRFTVHAMPLVATLTLASAAPVLAATPAIAPASSAPGQMVETEYGPMLVSSTGMSLYLNTGDDVAKGTSTCTKAQGPTTQDDPTSGLGTYKLVGYMHIMSCLDLWKPYQAPADAKASGDWSVFTRPEGGRQWAWQGKPLYFSVRDTFPGDKNGLSPDPGNGGDRGGGFGRGGGPNFRFAGLPPATPMPQGLKLARFANALVLATAEGQPVYTPRAGARIMPASYAGGLTRPLEAASIAKLDGDWSMVDAGPGRAQYAWKGKALFVGGPDATDSDIAKAGFEKVVYRKLPAPPPEISSHVSLVGDVYTDKLGKTLYTYTCATQGCDLPGGAAAGLSALCSTGQECMRRWHPYLAGPAAHASGEWTIIDLPQPLFTEPTGILYPAGVPRVKAWAYRGKPVFTYYEDKDPGDIWGITVRWFNAPPSFSVVRVPRTGT